MRSRFESNLLSARSTLPSRPISPQMLSVVKAHTTFLVAVRSSLTDTSTWDATRASHVVKLITSIRSLATIDLQDAANTLEHIHVCGCFSADQQKDIVATINSSASGPVCSPASDRSTLTPQEHFYLHRYMSHADWSTLRSPTSSMSTKITTLVNRCVQIGLLSLTEKTSQSIVCTLAATCDHHVDHSEMYNNMVGLKAAFRKMRLSRCVGTCKPSLAKFPEDVSQFISQFPGFYDVDDQPVKCPIDEAAIMSLRSQVAGRKTQQLEENPPCRAFLQLFVVGNVNACDAAVNPAGDPGQAAACRRRADLSEEVCEAHVDTCSPGWIADHRRPVRQPQPQTEHQSRRYHIPGAGSCCTGRCCR